MRRYEAREVYNNWFVVDYKDEYTMTSCMCVNETDAKKITHALNAMEITEKDCIKHCNEIAGKKVMTAEVNWAIEETLNFIRRGENNG